MPDISISKLRGKHPRFIYKHYSYKQDENDLLISYHFQIKPDLNFHPKIKLLNVYDDPSKQNIDPNIIDKLVFSIGMVELLSYWKATISPEIEIQCYSLSEEELTFWNDLLLQGMGEFFFLNKIDFTVKDFVRITTTGNKPSFQSTSSRSRVKKVDASRYLIPIGGGKDSAVALNIIQQHFPVSCLVVKPSSPAANRIAKKSKCQETITIERSLDPLLLDLNKKGYLNGHTPFSALLAFISILTSYIKNYQYVLIANEASANQENIRYKNREINHQYSKSFDFEQKFNTYIKNYIFPDEESCSNKDGKSTNHPNYISILRPLHEIQIAKLFSKLHQCHQDFRSCNQGQKTDLWCEQCPKCLFVFIMLFPFIDKKTLTKQIFSRNLFDNKELLPLLKQLVQPDILKPFECVGTKEETQAALGMAIDYYQNKNESLPILLQQVKPLLDKTLLHPDATKQLLKSWNKKHLLPLHLEKLVRNAIYENN